MVVMRYLVGPGKVVCS